MLKKLIKYDLKWSFKVVSIFLGLGFAFAVLGKLFSLIENSTVFNIISLICNGTALSLIISGLINCIIRSWVRIITNLYKDESYLTHTLPISRETHYLSKIISFMICEFHCNFLKKEKKWMPCQEIPHNMFHWKPYAILLQNIYYVKNKRSHCQESLINITLSRCNFRKPSQKSLVY